MNIRGDPALKLFFLSPILAEMLSGSAPPMEFFNPIAFIILSVLYGGGAILIREAKVRWKKDFLVVLYLGVAYAIAEEGLFVKSFFDPYWIDLGVLRGYGRVYGVNWVWTNALIFYHAIVSIAIPIAIVELIHIDKRNISWISGKKLKLLFAAYSLNGLVIFAFLNPYLPEPLPYLVFTLIGILIVLTAKKVPRAGILGKARFKASTRKNIVFGFFTIFALYFSFFGLPNYLPPPATISIGTAILLILGLAIYYNSKEWEARHTWALSFGALLFFIILAPIQELDPTRVDDTRGMTIIGILTLIFMLWLRRRVWEHRE